MGRHIDYDLSNDYTQPFRDKYWLQQTIQVQTAEGPAETRTCMRDLDPTVERGFLQRGAADMRRKMMLVEMTTAEQKRYLRHHDNSGSKLTALTTVMP